MGTLMGEMRHGEAECPSGPDDSGKADQQWIHSLLDRISIECSQN